MDPVNVVVFGAFIESTPNGDIYRLNGEDWLVYEEFADSFGGRMFAQRLR